MRRREHVRVEAHRVSRRFGALTALSGVTFCIEPGRKVALIGPNGSGKSTLNRILMGLLSCDGEVRIDGRSPFRERVSIARGLAYVPQTAPQLGARVDELVAAVTRVRGIEPAAVKRVAAALELDLGEQGRHPFRTLSGGIKQKFLIALAFSAGASLLLLDEPTGSLDAHARGQFFELFGELDPRITLILCSHRLEEIRPLVDHVLFLDNGHLVYDGAAASFLDRCTTSVLEVWADAPAAHVWLRSRGFRPTAAGVWVRNATHAEKLRLLPELTAELGSSLHNANARDLEHLDLTVAGGGGGRG
jgi:ABC-type multidrug transport system ATPase subunit